MYNFLPPQYISLYLSSNESNIFLALDMNCIVKYFISQFTEWERNEKRNNEYYYLLYLFIMKNLWGVDKYNTTLSTFYSFSYALVYQQEIWVQSQMILMSTIISRFLIFLLFWKSKKNFKTKLIKRKFPFFCNSQSLTIRNNSDGSNNCR